MIICSLSASSVLPFSSSLTSWLARGFITLPCRDGENQYLGPTRTSIFSRDGLDFLALVARYSEAALSHTGDPQLWPLDDGTFAARVARESMSAQGLFPHVARVDVPANSTVLLFGDLHGSFHSLARSLWSAVDAGRLDAATLVIAPNIYFLFLGDYVDRGAHGLETLGLLLALKTANPQQVFMSRGNHEDALMNDGPSGGFAEELALKFESSAARNVAIAVQSVYDSLPMAIFLGGTGGVGGGKGDPARHTLCCHGGLEVGFDPSAFLAAPLRPISSSSPVTAATIGFALIHGFTRGSWLTRLAKENVNLAKSLPRDVSSQLKDTGSADTPHPLPISRCMSSMGKIVGSDVAEVCHSQALTHHSAWLSDVIASRKAAETAWGGENWPVSPMGVNPAPGFMWADFLADNGKKSAVYQQGRGLAWGLPAVDHVLRATGLVGVFRAHQHNNAEATGPMLDRVIASGGAYNNWDSSGHVVTFLSGANIPGLGFASDAHGVLTVPNADPRTWVLDVCSHAPGEAIDATGQPDLVAVTSSGEGGAGVPTSDGFSLPRPFIDAGKGACDAGHTFVCKPVGWRPVMHGIIQRGGEHDKKKKKGAHQNHELL